MMKAAFLLCLTLSLVFPGIVFAQGAVVVRVNDPFGSHCIDATTDEVTIHFRRLFTEKTQGLFTEDRRAGVLVTAKVTGRGPNATNDVQVPSVNLLSVEDEPRGRVSVPLEYQIASSFALHQDELVTTNIQLSISLAKTRGRNTFGEILDLAGKALAKLPIPPNPYVGAANKFLQFANDAINDTSNKQLNVPFAEVSLSFNKGQEPDLAKCKSAGNERTGAFAVLLARGAPNSELVPVTNTDQLYCFSYSSSNTYELLAANKSGGVCPSNENAYQAVNNDYVMFLISAHPRDLGTYKGPATSKGPASKEPDKGLATWRQLEESRERCMVFGLPPQACGIGIEGIEE
jgi:hypothetical protein